MRSKFIGLLFGVVAWAQPVYTVQTVAGSNPLGDGGPATNAVILNVNTVLTDAGGNVYLAENQGRIRRVGANGIISTVAGTPGVGSPGANSGDGGPATAADLNVPMGMATDGTYLYIVEYQACRIVHDISDHLVLVRITHSRRGGDRVQATTITLAPGSPLRISSSPRHLAQ